MHRCQRHLMQSFGTSQVTIHWHTPMITGCATGCVTKGFRGKTNRYRRVSCIQTIMDAHTFREKTDSRCYAEFCMHLTVIYAEKRGGCKSLQPRTSVLPNYLSLLMNPTKIITVFKQYLVHANLSM